MSSERERVDLWFDPACPWAWLTSRWLLRAAEVRPLDVHFNIMSLYLLNEGRDDLPERYREFMPQTRPAVRLAAAVERKFGQDGVSKIYTALGTRIHNQKAERDHSLLTGALTDAGLPVELADQAESTEYDDAIRASHDEGIRLVGMEVGTPIIRVGETAYFGPVLSRLPEPEQAGEIWDAARTLAGYPHFWELKRTRTESPEF